MMKTNKDRLKDYLYSLIIISTLILTILFSPSAFGAVIYVPGDHETIQDGINAASDGDRILVADGTYSGIGNIEIDFKGKAITVQSENGPENCIIDCEFTGRGFFFRDGEKEDSVLEGFTIMNGYDSNGGGIKCNASSPTIINCIITGNTAISDSGGGIFCDNNSSPTIVDCLITENSAMFGGGISCYASSAPVIIGCTISKNTSETFGGGLRFNSCSPKAINCTIIDNMANYSGGGIFLRFSSASITNCIVLGNAANDPGGGISCVSSAPIINNCSISGNSAAYRGGGILCNNYSNITVTNSILWGNQAPNDSEISNDATSTKFLAYCNIDQDGFAGINNNIRDDPLFMDITNPDPANWDLHLQLYSPCIDAGLNDVFELPENDLDGDIRIIDGNDDGNLTIDIGSDEFAPIGMSLEPNATTVIPGGILEVFITLKNNTENIQIVYFASNVTLPNGNIYPFSGYLFHPAKFTLAPYESQSDLITHTLPENSPLGIYTYNGYVGKADKVKINERHFYLQVEDTLATGKISG